MPTFTRMQEINGNFKITRRKAFHAFSQINQELVQQAFDFAYKMSFGQEGEHRDHRSGGTYERKNGEIFKDAFQGKLSEFALYNVLSRRHTVSRPNIDVWGLGRWDRVDLFIDEKKASVKSTKSYGHLLLLETKDYDGDGNYIPNSGGNGDKYDYFILVRINPSCESIMRRNKLLFASEANYDELKKLIINERWEYDIPGFITSEDFAEVIKNKLIMPKGTRLIGNSTVVMDASNYYIQAGDLRDINLL